jgi:3-hydroxymyristoyl/3-hydroxydecanoyl-(acyl carrier protein) dehydratase
MSPEAAQTLRQAEKQPLLPQEEREGGPILHRAAIQALLPHRDPFLFVDRVTRLDLDRGIIVARYDLAQGAAIFAGHFPHRPLWPGVLQVEAIGQTGGLLYLKQANSAGAANVALTHILGARFARPVTPGADLEVVARVFDDGLLVTIVGQCLQNGQVCSAAALTAL